MRGTFLIHKASHLDPQVMPAGEVWYLATEGAPGRSAWRRSDGLSRVGRPTSR